MSANMERWRGRVALVTGASVGIGFAVAEALSKSGMTVVGCARNIATIEELAKKVGGGQGKIHAIKCDLSKEAEILAMFKTIEGKFKHVDVLINNAGFSQPDDLLTGKTAGWKAMIDLNVLGMSICTREALRLMEKDKIDDGHIIHINSIGGHKVIPHVNGMHFYMATKHMVTALTKALNAELRTKKSKIRVTDISPGAVATEFLNTTFDALPEMLEMVKQMRNAFPWLTAKNIADAVLYVVGAPAHVTIQELIIMPTEEPAY